MKNLLNVCCSSKTSFRGGAILCPKFVLGALCYFFLWVKMIFQDIDILKVKICSQRCYFNFSQKKCYFICHNFCPRGGIKFDKSYVTDRARLDYNLKDIKMFADILEVDQRKQ
jgi:NAD-dependent dihydropyrimidine dehydrogenase PreA subunit